MRLEKKMEKELSVLLCNDIVQPKFRRALTYETQIIHRKTFTFAI